jgi:hypothetical protein
MRPFKRRKRTNCPLCSGKLVKAQGTMRCPACRIEVVGDSCRFLNLPTSVLGIADSGKG